MAANRLIRQEVGESFHLFSTGFRRPGIGFLCLNYKLRGATRSSAIESNTGVAPFDGAVNLFRYNKHSPLAQAVLESQIEAESGLNAPLPGVSPGYVQVNLILDKEDESGTYLYHNRRWSIRYATGGVRVYRG